MEKVSVVLEEARKEGARGIVAWAKGSGVGSAVGGVGSGVSGGVGSGVSGAVGSGVVSGAVGGVERGGESGGVMRVGGCCGSFRSVAAMCAWEGAKESGGKCVYVCETEDGAGYAFQDIRVLTNQSAEGIDGGVLFYPGRGGKGVGEEGRVIMQNRVLEAMEGEGSVMVVTYAEALCDGVMGRREMASVRRVIRKGESYDVGALCEELGGLGLERVEFVYEPGQYAVRGSIVDIFSFSGEEPYRVDFFGDEVESIRTFDVANQLSVRRLEECSVVGKGRDGGDGMATMVDYMGVECVVVMENMECVMGMVGMRGGDGMAEALGKRRIVDLFGGKEAVVDCGVSPAPVFNKNYGMLGEYVRRKRDEGKEVVIATENARQRERLETILGDEGKAVRYVNGALHTGFETGRTVLLIEHEIFGRYHRYMLTGRDSRRGKEALTLKDLKSLNVGDYVVHDDYGIGVFAGLLTERDANGVMHEMVRINYQKGDLLMVSLNSLHKVSKYSGGEGAEAKVSRLGSQVWVNTKNRTKEKLKDIARDLIRLYAKRKEEEGYSFSADSCVQAELESGFEYQDTPDQAKATTDVKRDMESNRPMDRLVCGDVGFGKTEIAVRAAVKAACDNKQVAVLVPTTVLAFQHYKTFKRRLEGIPVRVDYLSRTRTAAEAKAIVKDLGTGRIDIIIGTHKLLGKGLKYRDLGLLIIDEEQKFGVVAKEKIKQMRANIDTLTLTATPIPRTLQFSLLGARDLSVINTPPEGRYPIDTRHGRFDIEVVCGAIDYELRRGGQVLFVNNNIKELDGLKGLIVRHLPTVRVVVAHGRMSGEEIESVMLDFVQGEYDVLLSTSIIESGIDIANCNTIIINNAQNFGLSDLHQLRGRVGRSNVQAYCYLFTPPMECLTDESRKRMEAITTYTELGSGLNIAMRDLDIRGAGNLLGREQSGFIADLGFETYKKILAQAVVELKNGEFRDVYEGEESGAEREILERDCAVETDVEALLPSDYVGNTAERLALYRELDTLQTDEEAERFARDLEDRFGAVPEAAMNLIKMVRIRRLGNELGFERLLLKKGKMTGVFTTDKESDYFKGEVFGRIIGYVGEHVARCRLGERNGKPVLDVMGVEGVDEGEEVLRGIMRG